jgi:hypothetical protein
VAAAICPVTWACTLLLPSIHTLLEATGNPHMPGVDLPDVTSAAINDFFAGPLPVAAAA